MAIKLRFARKFLRSLSKIKSRNPTSDSELRIRSRRIKTAAYSSMARAVGPRKAWARALLFNLRTRLRSHPSLIGNRRSRPKKRTGNRASNSSRPGSGDQVDRLRGLVPGGEAMDVCTLLEETAHYIHCLMTQVNVMKAISSHSSN